MYKELIKEVDPLKDVHVVLKFIQKNKLNTVLGSGSYSDI